MRYDKKQMEHSIKQAIDELSQVQSMLNEVSLDNADDITQANYRVRQQMREIYNWLGTADLAVYGARCNTGINHGNYNDC